MIKHAMAAGLLIFALPGMVEAKGPKHCPPGLAKKNPQCVPPGLANKGVSYDKDDDYRDDRQSDLRIGDRVVLDGQEYIVVKTGDTVVLRRDDSLYRLPRIGDGSDYVRIGDVIVRVDPKTKAVFEIIELADLILG